MEALKSGDALASNGRYRASIKLWQDALTAHQDNADLTPVLREQFHRRIAQAYFSRSRLSLTKRANKKALRQGMARLQDAIRWDPENTRYLYELAQCHWRLGETKEALNVIAQALNMEGATAEMWYACALLKLHHGEPKDAQALLTEPLADKDLERLGERWFRLEVIATAAHEGVDKAIERWEARWGEIQGSDDAALKRREILMAALDDLVAFSRSVTPSRAFCARLTGLYQKLTDAQYARRAGALARLIGDMTAFLGNVEAALSWWAASSQTSGDGGETARIVAACEILAHEALRNRSFEKAGAWTLKGLAIQPKDAALTELWNHITLHLASELWAHDKREEARAAWQDALDRASSLVAAWNLAWSESDGAPAKKLAERWSQVCRLALERGEHAAAEKAGLTGAALLIKDGSLQEAKDLLKRLGRTTPATARLLGFILLVTGDARAARSAFEQAVAANAGDALACIGLAIAVDRSSTDWESKIAHWKNAVVCTDARWVRNMWRRRTLEKGIQAWDRGELDEAMHIFSTLLLNDREESDGWIWSAAVHLKRNRKEMAMVCFQEALTLNPASADALLKIGGCCLRSGLEKEAADYFARAQKVCPSPYTDLAVARMCAENGRNDLAFEHLVKAVDRCEKSTDAIYPILHLLLSVRGDRPIRPVLAKAAQVAKHPHRVALVEAAECTITGDWNRARQLLDDVSRRAESERDEALLEDARYYKRALILMLTTGAVDMHVFRKRLLEAAQRWAHEGAAGAEVDDEDPLKERAKELLQQAISQGNYTAVSRWEPPVEAPKPRRGLDLPTFGIALDWRKMLPTELPQFSGDGRG